jgi:3-hydroxymyristoyl/3-hydroxydecanoyl-(acyl carrier protein) dehydratase
MQYVGEFCIDAGHPSLPGHFPGRPVVPGVVLLDAAFTLILAQQPGRVVVGVPSVKFTQPVRPGQRVAVSCGHGAERLGFACAVEGRDVLRGVLTLGERR